MCLAFRRISETDRRKSHNGLWKTVGCCGKLAQQDDILTGSKPLVPCLVPRDTIVKPCIFGTAGKVYRAYGGDLAPEGASERCRGFCGKNHPTKQSG